MKRKTPAIILTVIIFLCLQFNLISFAISIDGRLNEKIWLNSEPQVIVASRTISNCGVEFGTLCLCIDDSNNVVYLGFKTNCDPATGTDLLPGVSVSVGGSDYMKLTTDGVSTFDNDKYNFSGRVYALSDVSYTAEVALGIKYGIEPETEIKFRFFDMDGIPSNVYSICTPPLPTEPVTTVPATEPARKQTTVKETTQRTTKPTTSRTTKPTTTKITTVRTTTVKTTRVTANNTQSIIANPPMPNEEVRTMAAVAAVVPVTKPPKTTVMKKKKLTSVVDCSESITVYVAERSVLLAAETCSSAETTTEADMETVTVNKRLMYAVTAGLIVLALAFCVAANMAYERRFKEKSADKPQ